ncbi:Dienelactone hydrolase [Andreprevotia lacus DSM 23236]|jgi:dienelactone hydrolase|uniref:Dienelactone hydrolase n=1 Tax=Andreprevotia lacus DSM 23236 TaxID=1121001 RepID=A0A1W1XVS6_9NEIS|nr:alpha/beta fold hydrolase [Andreprevotia lacus]SMC28090.1 Dienelactone hydrolase [Andreprevotia lacus DSM 23236]
MKLGKYLLFCTAALLCFSLSSWAQGNEMALRTDLGETIAMVPVDENFMGMKTKLETTVFKPKGDGPFPLLVINGGKQKGNPAFQPRNRYTILVQEFLKRGYAVALPMPRGFSKSDGTFNQPSCAVLATAEQQGKDLAESIRFLRKLPYIDQDKIVVAGHSFGGFSTLAMASEAVPGVRLVLNFSGGVRFDDCNWEGALVDAAEKVGASAKLDSIWLYPENDKIFPPDIVRKMHAAYSKGPKKPELVVLEKFRDDGHMLFGSLEGFDKYWWPVVERKLAALSLPTKEAYPEYGYKKLTGSGYAALNDFSKLPEYAVSACKEKYKQYVSTAASPRAFAFSEGGGCGFASDYDDPQAWAMYYCQANSKGKPCHLYLADDQVVWPGSTQAP